jgi:hypothetical protein
MAVGLGNYGLLGPGQQQHYTGDLAQLQLGAIAEQPGAMPEIGPSPDFIVNIDHPFNERSSLNQAWEPTAYCGRWCTRSSGWARSWATACSRRRPTGRPASRSAGQHQGRTSSVDVTATHHGTSYTTTITARLTCTLQAGATLPVGPRSNW